MALLDIPPSDVGSFGRQPESFLALSPLCLGPDPVRDVEALYEDAGHRAGGIGNWLIDEIHEAFIYRAAGYRLHLVFGAFRSKGGAGAVNAVEQVKIALRDGIGQGVRDGAAENVAIAHQIEIARIGNLYDVLRAAEHRHE